MLLKSHVIISARLHSVSSCSCRAHRTRVQKIKQSCTMSIKRQVKPKHKRTKARACRPSTPTYTALSGPGIGGKGPRRGIEASAVKKAAPKRMCTEENAGDKEVYQHSCENKQIQNGRGVFVSEDVWSGDKG